MADLHFVLGDDGAVRFVHSDEAVALCDAIGGVRPADITRASHVEPGEGGWYADMRPSLPPGLTPPMSDWMLGPFKTRADALAAEREWLRVHRGL